MIVNCLHLQIAKNLHQKLCLNTRMRAQISDEDSGYERYRNVCLDTNARSDQQRSAASFTRSELQGAAAVEQQQMQTNLRLATLRGLANTGSLSRSVFSTTTAKTRITSLASLYCTGNLCIHIQIAKASNLENIRGDWKLMPDALKCHDDFCDPIHYLLTQVSFPDIRHHEEPNSSLAQRPVQLKSQQDHRVVNRSLGQWQSVRIKPTAK
ncbi:uncharacterized protein [Physcomitrium patens]|uniref:uncharacterized protein n=1 Tax=Physcomitrium patens TaxID=3218 RepID=UPI003CCE19C1